MSNQQSNIVIPLKLADHCCRLEMAWIPSGRFEMDNNGRVDTKVHPDPTGRFEVVFPKGYWLGVYTVTQCQWEAVIGDNPSHFKGANLPVEMVSWEDAVDFCDRIQEFTSSIPNGYSFSLPTEAQWEYACRSGSTHKYQIGDDIAHLARIAWYRENIPQLSTQIVGQKEPNLWGLYDMLGNVLEWCLDGPTDYPDNEVHTDWVGRIGGPVRNLRGGRAWDYSIDALTCGAKMYTGTEPNKFFGFRLCLRHSEI